MSKLAEAVATCTQMLNDDVGEERLEAVVAEQLKAGRKDLLGAIERLTLRAYVGGSTREISIGLMAALPALIWGPAAYAPAAAGVMGLEILKTAQEILRDKGKRKTDIALVHHYDAFFTGDP